MTPPWLERAVLGATRHFHETYERLAPSFGYKTREASRVPWEEVPEANRALMLATVREVVMGMLPALLDGLCAEEPSEDEQSAAMGHYGWLPRFRAVMGRRRARIEKEVEE